MIFSGLEKATSVEFGQRCVLDEEVTSPMDAGSVRDDIQSLAGTRMLAPCSLVQMPTKHLWYCARHSAYMRRCIMAMSHPKSGDTIKLQGYGKRF